MKSRKRRAGKAVNHRQHKFVTSVTSNKEGRKGTDLGRNYRRIPGCELHDLHLPIRLNTRGSVWPRTGSRAAQFSLSQHFIINPFPRAILVVQLLVEYLCIQRDGAICVG